MARFILNIVRFIGFFLTLSLTVSLVYFVYNDLSLKDIPAPNLSNSYSFNEKVRFMKLNHNDVDVVSLGSSCTLNNLYSEVVVSEFNTNSYLNTSSWGLNMKDIFNMLILFHSEYQFSKLIIVSTFQDFQRDEKKINYSLVDKYLNYDKRGLLTHVKSFSLKYYFDNFIYAKKVRNDSLGFDNLIFDDYGAVPLSAMLKKETNNRWSLNFLKDNFIEDQYFYLDSIASYCSKYNIKMFFFQSPLREGLFTILDNDEKENYKLHIQKISEILIPKNVAFVNPDNVTWSDAFFNDAVHLNREGAKIFTETCFFILRNNN